MISEAIGNAIPLADIVVYNISDTKVIGIIFRKHTNVDFYL